MHSQSTLWPKSRSEDPLVSNRKDRQHHPDILETSAREQLPLPMSGIILCGGKSSRMGRQKAFLPYASKTLVEHRLDSMQEIFSEVFLVTNTPESFRHLSANVVKDIIPNRGPLVGILSGLLVSLYEHSFVIPCDMPLIDTRLMRNMASKRHGLDVLVYGHEEQMEPLVGIYSKLCIEPLEEAIFKGQGLAGDFIRKMNAAVYHPPVAERKRALPSHFNIDTPQDYGRLIT